jgi:hypothetical protein
MPHSPTLCPSLTLSRYSGRSELAALKKKVALVDVTNMDVDLQPEHVPEEVTSEASCLVLSLGCDPAYSAYVQSTYRGGQSAGLDRSERLRRARRRPPQISGLGSRGAQGYVEYVCMPGRHDCRSTNHGLSGNSYNVVYMGRIGAPSSPSCYPVCFMLTVCYELGAMQTPTHPRHDSLVVSLSNVLFT